MSYKSHLVRATLFGGLIQGSRACSWTPSTLNALRGLARREHGPLSSSIVPVGAQTRRRRHTTRIPGYIGRHPGSPCPSESLNAASGAQVVN